MSLLLVLETALTCLVHQQHAFITVVVMLERVDLHQGGNYVCHKAHHHNISDATVRAGVHTLTCYYY